MLGSWCLQTRKPQRLLGGYRTNLLFNTQNYCLKKLIFLPFDSSTQIKWIDTICYQLSPSFSTGNHKPIQKNFYVSVRTKTSRYNSLTSCCLVTSFDQNLSLSIRTISQEINSKFDLTRLRSHDIIEKRSTKVYLFFFYTNIVVLNGFRVVPDVLVSPNYETWPNRINTILC